MAAPTLISYTETASWGTAGATKTLGSISWQTGDIIAIVAGCENNGTLGVPTVAGLTFNSKASNNAASSCGTQLAAATAGSASSGTIQMTNSSSTFFWGFAAWVWRGSAGVGNSAEQHTTGQTVNMTPTAAHCGVVWGTFDFSAAAVLTILPTPTNTRQRAVIGAGNYTIYVSDLADQASSGATAYGLGSGTGALSTVVLEIMAGSPVPGWQSPTVGPSYAI